MIHTAKPAASISKTAESHHKKGLGKFCRVVPELLRAVPTFNLSIVSTYCIDDRDNLQIIAITFCGFTTATASVNAATDLNLNARLFSVSSLRALILVMSLCSSACRGVEAWARLVT